MSKVRRMFGQFKSIFVSEDLLVENEEHANIVTEIIYIFSSYCGVSFGEQDLNIYNSILPMNNKL